MKKLNIDKKVFHECEKNKFVEYDRCFVSAPDARGLARLLTFGKLVGGEFRVNLGNKILYEGNSLLTAEKIFNDTIDYYGPSSWNETVSRYEYPPR